MKDVALPSRLPPELAGLKKEEFLALYKVGLVFARRKTRSIAAAEDIVHAALEQLMDTSRWDPKRGKLRTHFFQLIKRERGHVARHDERIDTVPYVTAEGKEGEEDDEGDEELPDEGIAPIVKREGASPLVVMMFKQESWAAAVARLDSLLAILDEKSPAAAKVLRCRRDVTDEYKTADRVARELGLPVAEVYRLNETITRYAKKMEPSDGDEEQA